MPLATQARNIWLLYMMENPILEMASSILYISTDSSFVALYAILSIPLRGDRRHLQTNADSLLFWHKNRKGQQARVSSLVSGSD